MSIKPAILLVIHTPPPYGGGEIQAMNLKSRFQDDNRFLIFDYSRKKLTRSNQGLFNIKNIFYGIYIISKVLYLITKYRPRSIYFTLPKGFYAFLRNAIIISYANLLDVKVLGELPGTSFLFLDSQNSIKYKIGLFFLRKVDEIRMLSPRIASMHKEYYFKKLVIVENGVELPENYIVNEDVLNGRILNLLYVGSLEEKKGIFIILESLKLCKEYNIKFFCSFIGDWLLEKEKEKALDFIDQNDLSDFIKFHGIITGDKKWGIYLQSSVLIHPSYWDGVPLTILEAMGLGVVPISTNVGGIPDTITNEYTGIIIDKIDALSVFTAINSLYNDRARLKAFSDNCKKVFKDRFDITIFYKNIENWFTEKR